MTGHQGNSMVQENLTPMDTVNIVRSRMYYLLSLAFSYPGENLLSTQDELYELVAVLYPNLAVSRKDMLVELDKMEAEYINVFDGHEQKKYCKPYEGQWQEADRAMRQWEVKKFYRFFGLGLNRAINEMPDHIMYELEFMHYLCYRMVESASGALGKVKGAGPNQPRHYLQAQKDFLERHLLAWVDDFCRLLQEKTTLPFYVQLARVTAQFIVDDMEWLQTQGEEVSKQASGLNGYANE